MDEAIGNEIYERGRLLEIIGVVEDFNMLTPKLACEPILILPSGFRKETEYLVDGKILMVGCTLLKKITK